MSDKERALEHLALVRFSGDLSTKARGTRLRFLRRLVRNLEDALRSTGVEFRVTREWSRIVVEMSDPAGLEPLTRVAGVQSISAAERRPWRQLDDILRHGEEHFAPEVRGKRFAVRARRGGERHLIPFDSQQVERELGTRLLPFARGVDLDDPEVTAHVEIRGREAYFFRDKLRGPGGLPVGVEGKALALVSGGFDSAVAAWRLLIRGVALDYLFFNLGGAVHEEGVLRVAKILADRWSYGSRPRLESVDFQPVVAELEAKIPERLRQVVLKRLMLRAGEWVAEERRRPALVTGEAVGQVSSQTLENLAVISRAVTIPVLRPLVGFNKDDIVAEARRIGTFELSSAVAEYCAIVPRRPATRASLGQVERAEGALDLERLRELVAARRVVHLHRLDVERLGTPELEVDGPLDGATLLDLRPRGAFDDWRLPGALHLDFFEAQRLYPKFDREQTYVVVCEVGLKSAYLAELMRDAGFRAFNLKGGLQRFLRRHRGAEAVATAVPSESPVSR